MTDIIFWQHMVSPHQTAFLEQLARYWRDSAGGNIVLIFEKQMSARRQAQGWQACYPKGVVVISLEEPSLKDVWAEYFGKGHIHIFSGFSAYKSIRKSLYQALKLQEMSYVLAEKPNLIGASGSLKRLLYHLYPYRFDGKLSGIFAYGDSGAKFYRDIGFRQSRVMPFAYTVEAATEVISSMPAKQDVHFVFIGSDMARKNLKLLFAALSKLAPKLNWRLTVVSTDDVSRFRQLAAAMKIDRHITFTGPLAKEKVFELLGCATALVLPSVHDGWGVVVNEALMVGTKVIVSDAAGASCLVTVPTAGQVFKSGDVLSLQQKLETVIAQGTPDKEERRQLSAWAEKTISPQVIAAYLLECIKLDNANSLKAPWKELLS